jgi:hypothetical protein
MSNFSSFAKKVENKFTEIQGNGKLFKSSVSGDQLWEAYINSFKAEDNPVFRDPDSSTHNCNLDKSFIRRYGNIVAIDSSFNIVTMWDVELDESDVYFNSCRSMSNLLKSSPIKDVFFETYDELNSLPYEKLSRSQELFRLGFESNIKIYTKEEADKFGVVEAGKTYKFYHFFGNLKKEFVDFSGKSQATLMSEFRDSKNVFMRGLEEISIDTLDLVKDLIIQGSLLDGQSHLFKIEQIIPFKKEFNNLSNSQKDNWCWVTSYKLPFSKFRNELIGTLCVELTEGVELNTACQTWNKRVDPANFMKAKAPITQKQINDAKTIVEENGYSESFNRRFATIDDINVEEILHSNVGSGEIKNASIFDAVKPTNSTRHKRSQFDGIEEVSIEKFMKEILPTCSSIEAFVENRMEGNLVALTTATNKDSKKMFKWNNNFSWTYKGNLAGKSMIKDAVKSAGGKVDGVLRFSIIWNEDGRDILDFDAHALEPNRTEIYYSSDYRKDRGNRKTSMSGQLDVDMIRPSGLGVENITWSDKSMMKDGVYKLWIKNYDGGPNKGFKAEIEFEGQIYTYEHKTQVKGNVVIALVTLKDGVFSIEHKIPSEESNKVIWDIETNQFHKVNLVCLSPNHWGENNTGNKHYLFMIDGCKSDSSLRSFHNENLCADLVSHRKVMEVLGLTTMLEPTDKQLCGLGFNATVKDEIVLKLSGTFKRTIKVKF